VNPLFRKVALIAASLGLLVSLFIALNPDDDDEAATTVATTTAATTPAATTTEPEPTTTEATTATTTTEPPPTTTAPPVPDVVTIRVTVGANGVESVRRFSVRRGREVVLVVTSELADHVHLHGYDLMADVAPGAPGTIRFTADAPGRFEIELEDRGLQIAELEVRP
jgi:hypothetical protein